MTSINLSVHFILIMMITIIVSPICGLETDGRCMVRGICGPNPENNDKIHNLLCIDDGQSTLAKPKEIEKLDEVCPHFRSYWGDNICCTFEQILDMEKNFNQLYGIAGTCPTCVYNLRKNFCDFTCSPKQSKFLKVSETIIGPNREGTKKVKMAKTIRYSASYKFAEKCYESCKDVYFPSQGVKSVELLCGTSAILCDPKKLFRFMGDLKNRQTPFQINYVFDNEDIPDPTEMYHDPPTYSCNEIAPNNTKKCSCTDCDLSCPKLNLTKYMEKPPFMIGKMDGLWLISGLVFGVGTTLFLIYEIFFNKYPDESL